MQRSVFRLWFCDTLKAYVDGGASGSRLIFWAWILLLNFTKRKTQNYGREYENVCIA